MLGLLTTVAAIGRPLSAIAMKGWNGQTIFQDSLVAQERHRRFPSLGLLRKDLVDLLSAPVADAIVFDGRVVSISQSAGSVVARLANGRELTADLLIGADGLHSVIREHVVGEGSLCHAGYTVWRGIARLTFEAAVGTTWVGRGKQFGLFPLGNEQTYWFAACKARNTDRGSASDELAAYADAPEPIAEVIARTDPDEIVRTEIYDRSPLPRWSFDRITLLGDAAHPATPALGQGACQAIEDGVTLGACLAGAGDIATALRAYELRRIGRANAFVIEARRLGRLGLIENRLICRVRDLVLRSLPTALRQRQLTRMFDFAV
jgi:2-polyprenyl-6-methoxyphenol hydroxylase-like FAD-dependent oxidoreductase